MFWQKSYVHTIGDSTLDNLYWMNPAADLKQAKQASVEGVLQSQVYADGYTVDSLAYDGFTTKSLLNGDYIGTVLGQSPNKVAYMREKTTKDGFIRPLKKLQEKISADPNATHYVVLSVGGNDFRVNLGNPWRLLKDIGNIQKRYLKILDKIKSLEGKDIRPILMLQYRTDANYDPYFIYGIFGFIGTVAVAVHLVCFTLLTAPIWVAFGSLSTLSGGLAFASGAGSLYLVKKVIPLSVTKNVLLGGKMGMSLLGGVLQTFYQPILERAKKDRIPLLDLTNTFNPYDNLYECGIEPSEKGSKLIARGIHDIMLMHDYSRESMLYAKTEKTWPHYYPKANSHPHNWEVSYPSQ